MRGMEQYRLATDTDSDRRWNIYHSTTAYFFDPPCMVAHSGQPSPNHNTTFKVAVLSQHNNSANVVLWIGRCVTPYNTSQHLWPKMLWPREACIAWCVSAGLYLIIFRSERPYIEHSACAVSVVFIFARSWICAGFCSKMCFIVRILDAEFFDNVASQSSAYV